MAPKRNNNSKKVDHPAKVAKKVEKESVVVYCVIDGPKKLDTLPQLPMNLICAYLATAGDYIGLNNLRMASKGCKSAVDTYCSERKNILPFKSIMFTGFEENRTSFKVKLRLRIDSLPLHFYLSDLRKRIIEKDYEGEMICLTIAVRNNKDPVVEYMRDALSPNVDEFIIDHVPNEKIQQMLHRIIGNCKIEKMKITPSRKDNYFGDLTEKICSDIIATIQQLSIANIDIIDEKWCMIHNDSDKQFIENLVKSTKRGSIFKIHRYGEGNTNPLNISDSVWKEIVESTQKVCDHARLFDRSYTKTTWVYEKGAAKPHSTRIPMKIFEWRA